MSEFRPHLNSSGNVLISTLVSIGLSSIIMMVMMSMSDMQNRSLQHYMLKSEILDKKTHLIDSMSAQLICSWQFTSLAQTLNTTAKNPDGTLTSQLNFTQIHAGANSTSPKIFEVNQPIAPNSNLIVDRIQFTKIFQLDPEVYTGQLTISFRTEGNILVPAPLTIAKNIKVRATDPPNAKGIESCQSEVPVIIQQTVDKTVHHHHQPITRTVAGGSPGQIGPTTHNIEGHWHHPMMCPANHFVCGVQAKEQYGFGVIDINTFCCPFQ